MKKTQCQHLRLDMQTSRGCEPTYICPDCGASGFPSHEVRLHYTVIRTEEFERLQRIVQKIDAEYRLAKRQARR